MYACLSSPEIFDKLIVVDISPVNYLNSEFVNYIEILQRIDLTKIQSIPVIETPWKYAFFIDLTFNNIKDYINAIEKIKLSSELFKEFGLYKSEKL